jgi:hypothetical protein
VEAVSSPQVRVRVYCSLARLAWWDAQDPDTALRSAREALALYRTTEDTRGLPREARERLEPRARGGQPGAPPNSSRRGRRSRLVLAKHGRETN